MAELKIITMSDVKSLTEEGATELKALSDAPLCLKKRVLLDNEMIHILSEWILEMASGDTKLSETELAVVHAVRESLDVNLPFYEDLCTGKVILL